jgi:hypothetical protein
VVYGLTSLPAAVAGPEQWLRLIRGHWLIENRSHDVRDVTSGKHHSPARTGSLPQVMAALRNTAMGLLRQAGHATIAAATRRYAVQPREALALLGIVMTTKCPCVHPEPGRSGGCQRRENTRTYLFAGQGNFR